VVCLCGKMFRGLGAVLHCYFDCVLHSLAFYDSGLLPLIFLCALPYATSWDRDGSRRGFFCRTCTGARRDVTCCSVPCNRASMCLEGLVAIMSHEDEDRVHVCIELCRTLH
jgi:hypothetical protein